MSSTLSLFRRKRAAGFGLIEILLCVAIIAMLATLGVQSYHESRVRARDANLKSSVRNYRQAMELYKAQYNTYLVKDRSGGSCSFSYGAAGASADGYKLGGTGTGCVGFKGSGEGRVTKRSGMVGITDYRTKSIADILVQDGFLKEVKAYPENPNLNNLKKTSGSAVTTDDFILTVCDSKGREAGAGGAANAERDAVNFAVYAEVTKPSSSDTVSTRQLCGAGAYGWNTLEARTEYPPSLARN